MLHDIAKVACVQKKTAVKKRNGFVIKINN